MCFVICAWRENILVTILRAAGRLCLPCDPPRSPSSASLCSCDLVPVVGKFWRKKAHITMIPQLHGGLGRTRYLLNRNKRQLGIFALTKSGLSDVGKSTVTLDLLALADVASQRNTGLTGACVMVGASSQYIWRLTYNLHPQPVPLPSRYSDNQPFPPPPPPSSMLVVQNRWHCTVQLFPRSLHHTSSMSSSSLPSSARTLRSHLPPPLTHASLHISPSPSPTFLFHSPCLLTLPHSRVD